MSKHTYTPLPPTHNGELATSTEPEAPDQAHAPDFSFRRNLDSFEIADENGNEFQSLEIEDLESEPELMNYNITENEGKSSMKMAFMNMANGICI